MDYGIGLFDGAEIIKAVGGERHEVVRMTYANDESVIMSKQEFGFVWRYGRGPGINWTA